MNVTTTPTSDLHLASGSQIAIAHGDQAATVATVGASLREYTVSGADVVMPYAADEMSPAFAGKVLAPWPNRLRDGIYEYRGAVHELPLTEPGRLTALHGLVGDVRWDVAASDESSVTLEHTIVPTLGYPWPVHLRVEYALTDDGLKVTTKATNLGTSTAPYGLGTHPWISPGDAAVDECTLQVGARRHVVVDDRLLPKHEEKLEGIYDLLEPRSLQDVALDDAWTGAVRDDDGLTWARLGRPDGTTVAMWADAAFDAWQVCTGDDVAAVKRRAVAIEPMTCIADAFRTGDRLVDLEPGASHVAVWGLRVE